MVFGDVTLQSPNAWRGGETAKPGSGGWPTIRYYNKKTGVNGASYEKKTEMPPCEELGEKGGYLKGYIEEAASTTSDKYDCQAKEPYTGCDDKQKTYILKMLENTHEERKAEYDRLQSMDTASMKQDLGQWARQRIVLLGQIIMKGTPKTEL